MANRGELPDDHPVLRRVMARHADDVPAVGHRGRPPHHQYHLLDAARALMLLGAVAAVSTVVVGNGNSDAAAVWGLLGFVTWLLGVGLLWVVPLAGRFPRADALAGAAIANASAVLVYLLTPWN